MVLALIAAASLAATPVFAAKPCSGELAKAGVSCGTVAVPENRSAPGGRTIALNVAVLRSVAARSSLPPLFDIAGGPGLPSVGGANFYLSDGAAYRAHRDIVLVDQRGTGASNPLNCPELDRSETSYVAMFPLAAVARCRRSLAAGADLTRYGTDDAVADLDAVRAALGYPTVDLFALSYGTTVALRYLATYPKRVRAAVLLAVVPPSAMPPRDHAVAAERAIRLLFEDCTADPRCRAAFPDPGGDFGRALKRLGDGAAVPAPIFAEKLRTMMYSAVGARRIPSIVHAAASGNLAPFYAATRPGERMPYSNGMYLSVTCSESLRLMDYARAAAAARKTRFGDYRLKRQRAACMQWPSGRAGRDFLRPARADSAVLMISGRLDPVAPPQWATTLSGSLPNSRQLVIRDGGHIIDGLSGLDTCFDPLVIRFYESADVRALDASCSDSMRAQPFIVDGAR